MKWALFSNPLTFTQEPLIPLRQSQFIYAIQFTCTSCIVVIMHSIHSYN